MSKPKLEFQRGYKEVRNKIEKNARFNRSCNNCSDFYQAKGDTEELCQNPSVLEYDICVEGERVWCSYWRSMSNV